MTDAALQLDRYELYRVITDYDALKDGFLERIEDLDAPLSEIDNAAGLTPGHTQKLLCHSDQYWARTFTWKTLGPMLKGTGMALVLVIDDERFAATKATLLKRRKMMRPVARIVRVKGFFTAENARKYSNKYWSDIPPELRKKMMKRLAKRRWRRRSKPAESPAQDISHA
jgi:hypothetical protein